MNTTKSILLATGIAMIGLQSPLMAAGIKKNAPINKEYLLTASFIDTDNSGCISTEVFISGRVYSQQDISNVSLDILQRNDCLDKTLISGIGKSKLTRQNISFDPLLKHASLKTTLKIFDATEKQYKAVEIDILWQGTGKATVSHPWKYAVEPGNHIQLKTSIKRKAHYAKAFGTLTFLGKKYKLEHSDDADISLISHR